MTYKNESLSFTLIPLLIVNGVVFAGKQNLMSEQNPDAVKHSIKHEPKFCKCRVCHEYFYADTIAEARQACQTHAENHPDWGETVCYCPDF